MGEVRIVCESMDREYVFQQMMLEQLDIHFATIKDLISYTKVNSQWNRFRCKSHQQP